MKLPHVTIEYREEESCAIGKMSPELIVGFGLHWAWMFLCMYNGHNLFQTNDEAYSNLAFMVSLAVFAYTLLSYAAFLKRARALFTTNHQRERNRIIGAVCMFAGMVALAFVTGTDPLSTTLQVVSGVLTGFGSAIILMSFGVSFSVLDVATSSISAALSLIVAAVVYAVVMMIHSIAAPISMIICMALPFAELLCLSRCSRQLVDNLEFSMSTFPVHNASFGVRLGFPYLLMGFAMGFVRGKAFGAGEGIEHTVDFLMAILLAGIFACVLIVASMLAQRQTSYYLLRTLFPVAALLLGLSATPLGSNATFLVFSLMTTYFMLEISMWIILSDISQRFRISAFTVFGIGRSMLAFGTLISVLVNNAFPIDSELAGESPGLLVMVLVLLIAIRSFMPTNAELRSTLTLCNTCPAFFDRDDLADTNPVGIETVPDEVLDILTDVPVQNPDEEKLEEKPIESAEKTGHEKSSNKEKQFHDDDPLAPERLGRFKRKCLVIADTYLLSRKETEVLFLLAKGYNSSAIQKSLYISAGTANTHMRNIYRKLDVHSQQELIALVESVQDDSSS